MPSTSTPTPGPPSMRLQRTAGWIGVALGSVHSVVSPMGWGDLWHKVRVEGVWDTFTIDPKTPEEHHRAQAFWTSIASFGVPVLTLGGVVLAATRRGQPTPRWLGWTVLGWGSSVCVLAPRSPAWAIPAMGALLVLGSKPDLTSADTSLAAPQ